MDDRTTTVDDRPGAPASGGVLEPGRRRSTLPHHRRRRAVALLVLAGLAVLIGLTFGAGGGSALRRPSAAGPGYFVRIATLAGDGTGSFAATEQAAENGAVNHTLSYTPYVRIAGSEHREIALTFDDGPGPYTPQILSILERSGVPATFFEVGVLERYFHASTAAIAARGYPIGDHTEGHLAMGWLSPRDQRTQLLQQIAATGAYGAPFPRLFRPPYGSWDAATLRLLHRYKMLMVMWTVDTNDYRRPGATAIVRAAVEGARPGAIILLHDAGGDRTQTVAALPKIIKALHARGYRLVTVPKLLLDNPAPVNQQISAVVGSGG
jgi:peptidoglycan-N-acetylglucosamine deacetylase